MKLVAAALTILGCLSATLGEPSPTIVPIDGGLSGTGVTTRYWDCCKPSCSWVENIATPTNIPVVSCEQDGTTVIEEGVSEISISLKRTAWTDSCFEDIHANSGCVGGDSFMCSNQHGFTINSTLAYGFAAASFTGGADTNLCCACMLLTFQDQIKGKQMLVQVTNTGSDLQRNQFDIAIPGGGVGIYNKGCAAQWNVPDWGWGDPDNGVTQESQCDEMPTDLQSGCKYRFEFMEGSSNPSVSFYQVQCPPELVALSGCNL